MVSTRPLISKSSNPCTNSLETVRRAPITIGITVTLMFYRFLLSSKVQVFFTFILLYSVVSRDGKVHYSAKSTILLTISRSGRLAEMICLYLKIPEKFVSHSQGGFWVLYIPFVRMVKFKVLAPFPVEDLPHSVVSYTLFCVNLLHSLIMWWINSFLLPHNLYAILLRLIPSCSDIIGSYGVVSCCYQKRFSFSLKVSIIVIIINILESGHE